MLSASLIAPHAGSSSFLLTPHPAPRPFAQRTSLLRALANESANESLTFGDVLVSLAAKQVTQLPKAEQAARDERVLDAMTAASTAEMDTVLDALDRELQQMEDNTTRLLAQGLRQRERSYDAILNKTAEALAPSRMQTARISAKLQAELDARREAKQRETEREIGSASSWRDEDALVRLTSPRHPVALTAEVSSLVFGVMLLITLGDFLTGQYRLTATVDQAPIDEQLVEYWWVAMRAFFAVYVASLGYIFLRSGSEEWASSYLFEPSGEAGGGTSGVPGGGRPGLIKWVYDFESDRWREVPSSEQD